MDNDISLVRKTFGEKLIGPKTRPSYRSSIHKFNPPLIIRFFKLVFLANFAETAAINADHYPGGGQQTVILFETTDVLKLAICHGLILRSVLSKMLSEDALCCGGKKASQVRSYKKRPYR
jgi:hypothetical protein